MEYFKLNLPIFKTENGKIIIPENTQNIWFDVGASFNSPNSVQFLKRNPNGFAIGFEPDPRMYFTVYCAYLFSQNLWLLDKSHVSCQEERHRRMAYGLKSDDVTEFLSENDIMSRYIIVPTAISNQSGENYLSLDAHAGSSALHASNENFLVPTRRLDEFINMIPDRFQYLDHLKIDAEGHDGTVIESAGDLIKRFVVVTSEADTLEILRPHGFEHLENQNGGVSYVNVMFKHLLSSIDYKIRI